jgi:histidinol-phosphate aminotransferase
MTFDLSKLLRPHIAAIKPYSSARDEYSGKEGVFLDANENPYGSLTERDFNRYPDPYQAAIKQKLSAIKGVPADQIFLGNGSDEAIDLLMRAFCVPGQDNIILLPPTYGMYEVSAGINDIATKKVNLTRDFQLDPEKVLKAVDDFTKIIFVCSPNNPSGNKLNRDAIKKVLTEFKGLVVVDEAYVDFNDEPSFITELNSHPNLLVMQTFSKAWGLANLRVGMAFASGEVIHILNLIKPPYNISGLAQEMVLESLDKADNLSNMVAAILAERSYLIQAISELSLISHIYPSQANFILVRVPDPKGIYDYLIENRIIIRDRSKVTLCENCLRITVGTRSENNTLLEALKHYHFSSANQS